MPNDAPVVSQIDSQDERTFRVRAGTHGGAYPEVGMPIEDPETREDLVITAVRPAVGSVFTIATHWPHVPDSIPMFTDEHDITARPATPAEVEAWQEVVAKQEAEFAVSLAEYRARQPWWRRVFG